MQRSSSSRWLEGMLAGGEPSPDDLRQLVKDCVEDQHADFKSGLEFEDEKKARDTLREYAAAFANSDGGFMLVGYHQGRQEFDGAPVPGGGPFREWAARTLSPIGHFLQPPPRLYEVVLTAKVRALVMAVWRSSTPVSVIVAGRPVYYLRIGDSNIAAPEYLVADLLLGRRNRPALAPLLEKVDFHEHYPEDGRRTPITQLDEMHVRKMTAHIRVDNVGFAFAQDVRVGVVAFMVDSPNAGLTPPPQPLGPFFDVADTPSGEGRTMPRLALYHTIPGAMHYSPNLRAFEQLFAPVNFRVPMFAQLPLVSRGETQRRNPERAAAMIAAGRGFLKFSAALYLFALGSEPLWYELRVAYKGNGDVLGAQLSTAAGSRPVVGVSFLPEDEDTHPLADPFIPSAPADAPSPGSTHS